MLYVTVIHSQFFNKQILFPQIYLQKLKQKLQASSWIFYNNIMKYRNKAQKIFSSVSMIQVDKLTVVTNNFFLLFIINNYS